jgi:hypothetical protein
MLVVHVDNLISAKEVISLGADGIVHSFMGHIVDEEFIQMMLTNNSLLRLLIRWLAANLQLVYL